MGAEPGEEDSDEESSGVEESDDTSDSSSPGTDVPIAGAGECPGCGHFGPIGHFCSHCEDSGLTFEEGYPDEDKQVLSDEEEDDYGDSEVYTQEFPFPPLHPE